MKKALEKSTSGTMPRSRVRRSGKIALAVIRRYVRQIAGKFRPRQIVLFGSYACGTPHRDSDIDLLVIMPAADDVAQAVKIRLALPAPFPVDLLVRTPSEIRRNLRQGDWFLGDVMANGKILYEAKNGAMASQSRVGLGSGATNRRRKVVAP